MEVHINYLITGGTGTLGQELTNQLLKDDLTEQIVIFSRNEYLQWEMAQQYKDTRIKYAIGDIRDKERLEQVMHRMDYIIHTAALKHVPVCEDNISEAIQTNIIGSQNVAGIAKRLNCRAIAVSTDKAVYPINVYGATKFLMERIFLLEGFPVIRFGNFWESHGNVVSLFQKQKILTITNPTMVRYWIDIKEAANFILKILRDYKVGIYIPKMETKTMGQVAKEVSSNSPIEIIGIRNGEKIEEVLFSSEELVEDKGDYYFIRRYT